MLSVDETSWMILVKFGQREHLQEFREGILHMNSQAYFTDLKDNGVRGDRFEGTDQIHQPIDIKYLRIEDNVTGDVVLIKPESFAGPLLIGFSSRPSYNLFCMSSVTQPNDGPFVDGQNLAFGDSFTVILNTQQFIDKARDGAKSSGLDCFYGLVEYYDETAHSGETGVFRKPSSYAYQQEFRLAVTPGSRQPVRLSIGSLIDITSGIYPLADINRIVRFTPPVTP